MSRSINIAVQAPAFLFQDQTRNFNGYNFQFLKKYHPLIFLKRPWHYLRYRRAMTYCGLRPGDFEFILNKRSLNARAEILLCFNGMAHVPENAPPRGFDGLKIWHCMDYAYYARRQNDVLEEYGVDYLMAYASLDRFCGFFQFHYPGYIGRIINVPFGFGQRFTCRKRLEERVLKCIALGAITPIEPNADPNDRLCDWFRYFQGRSKWSHQVRRFVVEHEVELAQVIESQLPHFPKCHDPNYDAPTMMNDYVMFLNDSSIGNFPPARTYEGVAAGSIMVALDHPVFRELGFEDRVNCIFLQEISVKEMTMKIQAAFDDDHLLRRIQQNGLKFIERFSHERVAQTLHRRFVELVTAQST